jgi:hypothetical protein
MLENAFAHGTDLRSTDRPWNGLVEHFDLAAVSTSNQIVDSHGFTEKRLPILAESRETESKRCFMGLH